MALDSEAKRWSMLRHINGYSHVINPSGSDFDSQVERLTLLNIYGGSLAADVTAPVLSSATGTSTGTTTATGTVDTDEGNGTLYFYASTNSSELAATIKAEGSQAVTVSGTQNVSFTGLTAGTEYYAHYVQDDSSSNESNVVSSTPAFTTTALQTGGNFYPPKYVKTKRRKKDDSIKESIEALLTDVKEAPVIIPQKVENQVRDAYDKVPEVINIKSAVERTQKIAALTVEINTIRKTVKRLIKEDRDDEEAAIQALLEIM